MYCPQLAAPDVCPPHKLCALGKSLWVSFTPPVKWVGWTLADLVIRIYLP